MEQQPGDNEEASGNEEATTIQPDTKCEATTAVSPAYGMRGRVRGASPLPFAGSFGGSLPAYTSPIPRKQQVVVKLQGFPAMGDVPPGLISRLQSSLSRCQALMGAEAYAVVSCAAHLGSMCIVLEVQHQQEQHTHAQQPHSTQQHTAAVKLAGALVSEIAHDMRLSGPEHASSQTAYIQVNDVMCVSVLDPSTRTWHTTASPVSAWAPASQQEAHFLFVDPFIFSNSPPTQLPASLASRYVSLKLGVVLQHLSRSPPSSLMPYRVRGWAPSALNISSSHQAPGAGPQHEGDNSSYPVQPLRILLRCGHQYLTTRVLRQRAMCHVLSERSAPAGPRHAAQLNTIAVELEAFVSRQVLENSAATAITGSSLEVPSIVRPMTVELWQGHVLLDSTSMLCVGELGLIDPDRRPEREVQRPVDATPAAAGALIHISDASDTTGLAASPPGAQALTTTTTSLGMATARSSSTGQGLGHGWSLGAPLPEHPSFLLTSASPASTSAGAAEMAATTAAGLFLTEVGPSMQGHMQPPLGQQLTQHVATASAAGAAAGVGPSATRPVLPRDLLDGRVSLTGEPGMLAPQWHTPASTTAQPAPSSRQLHIAAQADTGSIAGTGIPLLFQPLQQGAHSVPFQLGSPAQPPARLSQQALLGSMSAVYETSRASFSDDAAEQLEQQSPEDAAAYASAALDELLTLGNSPGSRLTSPDRDVFDPAVLSDESEDVLQVEGPDFIQVLDLNSSSPIAVWRPTQQQDAAAGGLSEASATAGPGPQARERHRGRQRTRGGTDWDAEELVLDPLDELLLHADRDEAELAAYRHRLYAAMQQQQQQQPLAAAGRPTPSAAYSEVQQASAAGPVPASTGDGASTHLSTADQGLPTEIRPHCQVSAPGLGGAGPGSGPGPGVREGGHRSELVGLVLAAHAVAFPADPLKETLGISESSPPSYVFCLGTLHALLAQLQFGSSTADVGFTAGGLTGGGSQVDRERRQPETELAWALGRLLLRESVTEGNVTTSKSLLSFLVPLLPVASTGVGGEGSQAGCGLCSTALSELVGAEVAHRKSKLVGGLTALGGDLGAVRCCMLHHPLQCCHAKQGTALSALARGQTGLQPIPEVPEDSHNVQKML